MLISNPKIGIIGGTGKYGQWWKNFFQSCGLEVLISSRRTELTNIDLAKTADIVIVCVPVRETVKVIEEIAAHVRPEALLCDLTSLKVEPVKAMLKSESGVTGLHPLFGPLVESLIHQQIVFCRARDNAWTYFLKNLFIAKGATIIETTPEEHDHQMAMIQALTHLVNITFAKTIYTQNEVPNNFYSTPVFKIQSLLMGRIMGQNPSLYADIELLNPEFIKLLRDYKKNLNNLSSIIETQDFESFESEFKAAASYLQDFIKDAEEKSNEILKLIDKQKERVIEKTANSRIDLAGSGFRVGYLGPVGTFSHEAAVKIFNGGKNLLVAYKSVPEIFNAVQKGEVEIGLVPAENSTSGLVFETIVNLIDHPVKISGAYNLAITQNLLARTESLNNIKLIKSHLQPLAQCRQWLKIHFPGIPTETYPSTVAAILSDNSENTAYIGSELAAREYGLNILAKNIEDKAGNTTKFYLIAEELNPDLLKQLEAKRTLLLLAVYDRVGILHDILHVFAANNLNLTRLHSIPSSLKAWDYYFFFEVDASLDDVKLKKALEEIKPYCPAIRVLGGA